MQRDWKYKSLREKEMRAPSIHTATVSRDTTHGAVDNTMHGDICVSPKIPTTPGD